MSPVEHYEVYVLRACCRVTDIVCPGDRKVTYSSPEGTSSRRVRVLLTSLGEFLYFMYPLAYDARSVRRPSE